MIPTEANLVFVRGLLKPEDLDGWKKFVARQAAPQYRDQEKDARYRKKYQADNREKLRACGRAYRDKNIEYVRLYQRVWLKESLTHVSKYHRDRRNSDLGFKLLGTLRNRLGKVLRGISKSARAVELLGMEILEYRIYLQGQFRPGMTWENYGSVWHIDHIRPCASFDLTDAAQQRECFNWSNTQPLFAEENLRKGAHVSNS